MLRTIVAVVFLTLLAVILQAGGRGNVVHHYYADGTYKVILASQGSCRHHLTAHPLDVVTTVSGFSYDPQDCN